MSQIKKIVLLSIIILIILPYTIFANEEEEKSTIEEVNQIIVETGSDITNEPKINSRRAIIYDRDSKRILYGKCENERCAMASTTKIMTAIIVIENGNLNETVEISSKSANTGGSRLGLKKGDKIKKIDLLYGLLMCSGNDAAVALAENISGSVEEFAILMNNKAKELKLVNTNFVTPHGLDQPEHYTTAYELAKLTDYALTNKLFADIVNTKNYVVNINDFPKNIHNTNELLGVLEGVNGVKTGFTNGAGRCLVTSASRSNMNIICVVLGADTKKIRTSDSVKLIEYAYREYELIELKQNIEKGFEEWNENDSKYIKIEKGKQIPKYKIAELKNTKIPIKKNEIKNLEVVVKNLKELKAPIKKETIIGNIKILIKNKEIYSVNILVEDNVEKNAVFDYYKQLINNYMNFLQKSI